MDIVFLLEDGTVAHFEYEFSEPTVEDQIRYIHYDTELYSQRRQKVHRIVVYGAGIKKRMSPLDLGSVRQIQTTIYLEEHFDGDAVFSEIALKIRKGEVLSNLDKVNNPYPKGIGALSGNT